MNAYFRSFPIARGVTYIEDLTKTFCYLVEGSERAALIDTGCGVGNIASYVKTLTTKPVIVLITHVHPDHTGGIFGFKETQIYISEKDIPALDGRDNSYEARKEFLLNMNGGKCPCPDEEIFRYRPMQVNVLKDGDTFDLGGRALEAIAAPGHTHGSTVFLDRAFRMIFLGDAANQNTLLSCESSETVETYYQSLLRLKTFEDAYDSFFICHGAPIAAKQTVDDLIELCEEVIEESSRGNLVGELVDQFNPYGDARRVKPVDGQMNRLDGKQGNMVYRPGRVRN